MIKEPTSSTSRLKALFEGILRSPLRLRSVVGAALLGGWYFALYQPTVAQIETKTRHLGTERKRLELAVRIEDLRILTRRFQERLPRSPDQNEVVQYLMGGIRQLPIKLVTLEPKASTDLGPYRLIQVAVLVEGDYASLEAMVRWIETDEHLFRIDQIEIVSPRTRAKPGQADVYSLKLTVVGLLG